MKRKDLMDVLIFAKVYLKSQIESNEILMDALGIDPEEKDEAEQKSGGVHYMYRTTKKERETLSIIENELEKLSHVPKEWYTVGADNFGFVHICPYCNEKSPEMFHFCPNCGENVAKGV